MEKCFISSQSHSGLESPIKIKIEKKKRFLSTENCKQAGEEKLTLMSYVQVFVAGTCRLLHHIVKEAMCALAHISFIRLALCNVCVHRHMLSFNDSSTGSTEETMLRLQGGEK